MMSIDKERLLATLKRIDRGKIREEDVFFLNDACREMMEIIDVQGKMQGSSFWADRAISLVKALVEISSLQQGEAIARAAVESITRYWGMDSGALIVWDADMDKPVNRVTCGDVDWEGLLSPYLEMKTENMPLAALFDRDYTQLPWVFNGFDDEGLTDAEKDFIRKNGIKTLVTIPIMADGMVIGLILTADVSKEHALTEQQLALGGLFANQAGILIERTRLYKATQKRAAELQALHQISLSLTASLDLQKVLQAILESTLRMLVDAEDAHIFLFDGRKLSFGAVLWLDGNKEKVWSQPRENGLTNTVAQRGNLIYIPDMQRHELFKGMPSNWKGSIIGMPLKIGHRVVGVMTVAHPETNAFTADEIRILRLIGDQAAIAIENARLHDLANRQAHTDMLTNLPNRRALIERLEDEIRRSKRYEHYFTIVMMDLDRFKRVNDTFGHPTGDAVLKNIAESMSDVIRETDFLARYGGDEFTLLLPETDFATAKALSDRLKEVIAGYCDKNRLIGSIKLGLSVGIATFPEHGKTVRDLLASADSKMYRDKTLG